MTTLYYEMPQIYTEHDGDILPLDDNQTLALEMFDEDDLEYNAQLAGNVENGDGPSILIADRAIAIESIMKYLNKANGASGLARAVETPPFGAAIRRRYGDRTPDVVSGAQRNVLARRGLFDHNLAILVGADAMREQGVPEDRINQITTSIQAEINHDYGVGNAKAPARNAKVTQIYRSAKTILS